MEQLINKDNDFVVDWLSTEGVDPDIVELFKSK